ncbi:MAG: hypothetical protein Q9195_004887 [Heterodermia aff. obscurata]
MATGEIDVKLENVFEKYEYPSLPTNTHIRLITLNPKASGTSNPDEVRIYLNQHPINECPKYTALSYTWGQPHRTEDVVVENFRQSIKVTENLHAALVHLRRREPVKLWIDAICINQDDIKERSSQVRLMRQIYRGARQVVAWIHNPDEPLSSEDEEKWTFVKAPGMEDYHLNKSGEWTRTPREIENYPVVEYPMSQLRLFQHPWFMRVWILQEVAYARHIVLKTGKQTLYWDEVQECVGNYHSRVSHPRNTRVDEPTGLSMAMVSIMSDFRHSIDMKSLTVPLSNILYQTQYCGATDPKDKIFALLSLANDVKSDFEISYEWSWSEISKRLTRHMIQESRTLDLLRCVGTRTTTLEGIVLPSWVPDLSGQITASPLHRYNRYEYDQLALEYRLCDVALCNETMLVVRGLWVHEVAHIESNGVSSKNGFELYCFLDSFRDWHEAAWVERDYPRGQGPSFKDNLNEFWGTIRMTKGSQAVEEHVGKKYDAGEGWHWHFRKILNEESIGDSQPEDPFDPDNELWGKNDLFDPEDPRFYSQWARDVMFPQEALQHVSGRAFGFTKTNQLGLFPRDTRKNDKICLLSGIQIPFVLRETDRPGSYKLIGACYIHESINWARFESDESRAQLQWITLE